MTSARVRGVVHQDDSGHLDPESRPRQWKAGWVGFDIQFYFQSSQTSQLCGSTVTRQNQRPNLRMARLRKRLLSTQYYGSMIVFIIKVGLNREGIGGRRTVALWESWGGGIVVVAQ